MNLPNYEAKVTTTNCYYGKCTVDADFTTDGNAGTAVEKTEVEFADGTVKGLLGVFIKEKNTQFWLLLLRTTQRLMKQSRLLRQSTEAVTPIMQM